MGYGPSTLPLRELTTIVPDRKIGQNGVDVFKDVLKNEGKRLWPDKRME
jgi:hypothetical protein